MTVYFSTERGVPKMFRDNDLGRFSGGPLRLGDGDFGTQAAQIIQAASPWNLLKGVFVDKPMAQAAAQQAVSQAQAEEAAAYSQDQARIAGEQQATLRTGLMIGAGLLGLVAVVSLMRRPAKAVSGYRSRRKRSRR